MLRKVTYELFSQIKELINVIIGLTFFLTDNVYKFLFNSVEFFIGMVTIDTSQSSKLQLKPTDDLLHDTFSLRMLWVLL